MSLDKISTAVINPAFRNQQQPISLNVPVNPHHIITIPVQ
jgi:hypothetical protein